MPVYKKLEGELKKELNNLVVLIIDLLKGLASFDNQYCLITSYFSFKASEFSRFNVICLF